MKLVFLIPCYNEENTVGDIIKNIKKHYKGHNLTILAIDDCSTDNTLNILKKNTDNLIELKKKVSLAKVIKIGLKKALENKFDILVQIDADGQYNPKDIQKLIYPIINENYDFVIGNRKIWFTPHMPLLKKIGNEFFSRLTSIISKVKIIDAQSGFRAMKYDVVKTMNIISNYTYTQEQVITVAKKGYNIKQIPVKFIKRKYGRSRLIKNLIIYGIKVSIDLIRILLK